MGNAHDEDKDLKSVNKTRLNSVYGGLVAAFILEIMALMVVMSAKVTINYFVTDVIIATFTIVYVVYGLQTGSRFGIIISDRTEPSEGDGNSLIVFTHWADPLTLLLIMCISLFITPDMIFYVVSLMHLGVAVSAVMYMRWWEEKKKKNKNQLN